MSGGSFDYAYRGVSPHSDLRDLIDNTHNLTKLAESMAANGYQEGAVAIMKVITKLRIAEAWFEAVTADGRLADLAKAYEWWQSCDWSESQFQEALAKYLSLEPAHPSTKETTR